MPLKFLKNFINSLQKYRILLKMWMFCIFFFIIVGKIFYFNFGVFFLSAVRCFVCIFECNYSSANLPKMFHFFLFSFYLMDWDGQ